VNAVVAGDRATRSSDSHSDPAVRSTGPCHQFSVNRQLHLP